MSVNKRWPILAAPPASFFQARKPHKAPPPHAENRSLADPSSRIHIPVNSLAIAGGAEAARIAKATSKARAMGLSLGIKDFRNGR
jgi:hypothetical protein